MSTFYLEAFTTTNQAGVLLYTNGLPNALESDIERFYERAHGQVLLCSLSAYKALYARFETRFKVIVVASAQAYKFESTENVFYVCTVASALQMAQLLKVERAIVVGDAHLYKSLASRIELTYVSFDGLPPEEPIQYIDKFPLPLPVLPTPVLSVLKNKISMIPRSLVKMTDIEKEFDCVFKTNSRKR